jgi:hypothetical protein
VRIASRNLLNKYARELLRNYEEEDEDELSYGKRKIKIAHKLEESIEGIFVFSQEIPV